MEIAMARKETVTKQMILDAAFEMAGKNGYREVTARKLASHIGCSTQPIFRVFTNMEELQGEYTNRVVSFFEQFYQQYPRRYEEPFVDLGMAYIAFAAKESHYFEMLFLTGERMGKSLYDILNGSSGNVVREIRKAQEAGCKSAEELFMRMWIFIHGAACMTITGDYDLTDEATAKLLIDTYHSYTK